MNKKAIIYDLDNTIYPVSSIGEQLFASLFELIHHSGEYEDNFEAIKADIMRKPFQVVASTYRFSDELTRKGINLLENATYDGEIKPYSDYIEIKNIPGERFLVTTGFNKLQYSKIRGMGIENDFKEIHVVDPQTSKQTKKDIFEDILERNHYSAEEVIVVGDDPESEIKAAQELGIETVLYDINGNHPHSNTTYKISSFAELCAIL
jgi:putative hydrolase of the HAD superfamily